MAYASAGPGAVRDLRLRPGPEQGRSSARDPAGRCGVDSAGRKALARRLPDQWHGPYRDAGITRRKLRDLDGAGDRRGLFRKGRRIAADDLARPDAAQLAAFRRGAADPGSIQFDNAWIPAL